MHGFVVHDDAHCELVLVFCGTRLDTELIKANMRVPAADMRQSWWADMVWPVDVCAERAPQMGIVCDVLEHGLLLILPSRMVQFEYGMSWEKPNLLLIWEAQQFGNLFNGAQVIIDMFIASAKSACSKPIRAAFISGACGAARTTHMSSIVLLLPHGLDGTGPEHLCACLECFLQLMNDCLEPTAGDMPANMNMHVTSSARERTRNKLKDFLTMLHPALTHMDIAPSLRIRYSLAKDVAATAPHPRARAHQALSPALLVLAAGR
ncbi:hypothetical protein BC834DRAFT_972698 [Gloeopeniophorella convolvens]|nr:hypothetical protein BC834DRAFT_972698 [Gloeopeniophorella convolvens]